MPVHSCLVKPILCLSQLDSIFAEWTKFWINRSIMKKIACKELNLSSTSFSLYNLETVWAPYAEYSQKTARGLFNSGQSFCLKELRSIVYKFFENLGHWFCGNRSGKASKRFKIRNYGIYDKCTEYARMKEQLSNGKPKNRPIICLRYKHK